MQRSARTVLHGHWSKIIFQICTTCCHTPAAIKHSYTLCMTVLWQTHTHWKHPIDLSCRTHTHLHVTRSLFTLSHNLPVCFPKSLFHIHSHFSVSRLPVAALCHLSIPEKHLSLSHAHTYRMLLHIWWLRWQVWTYFSMQVRSYLFYMYLYPSINIVETFQLLDLWWFLINNCCNIWTLLYGPIESMGFVVSILHHVVHINV